jgi:hypothetical protein
MAGEPEVFWHGAAAEISSDVRADLERLAAEHSAGLATVHAGAVGIDGRALVLPGASCAGKSTLVDALLRAGATYLSDEVAAIDETLAVHAFPRPIRLRAGRSFDAARVESELSLAAVIFCPFGGGAAWFPRPIGRGEALLQLLHYSFSAKVRPTEALTIFGELCRRVPVLSASRGDAAHTAELLMEYVSNL